MIIRRSLFSIAAFVPRLSRLLLAALAPLAALHAQSNYATPYTFTTLAGMAGASGSNDGTGSAARFWFPFSVAADAVGNVYIADYNNHIVRKITSAGVVTTLAGVAGSEGWVDGTGSAARFANPSGVAVEGAGNVYVTDQASSTIRKISPAGVVTTIAGSAFIAGSADGVGTSARFNNPLGIAVDGAGNLYVADFLNFTIRKITPTRVVTTFAGTASLTGGWADGTGAAAQFAGPSGVAVDGLGNVFVGDGGNQLVRKITSAGVVTTIGGTAVKSGSADDTGADARFNTPSGVAVTASGTLYVADLANNTIRKGFFDDPSLPVITNQPDSQTTVEGGLAFFFTTATGPDPLSFQWRHNGVNLSGQNFSLLVLFDLDLSDAGSYDVVVTNSSGATVSSEAVLTVIPQHEHHGH